MIDKLSALTYMAWQLSGCPQEKVGLIKKVFISNAGFLDRCDRTVKCFSVKDIDEIWKIRN